MLKKYIRYFFLIIKTSTLSLIGTYLVLKSNLLNLSNYKDLIGIIDNLLLIVLPFILFILIELINKTITDSKSTIVGYLTGISLTLLIVAVRFKAQIESIWLIYLCFAFQWYLYYFIFLLVNNRKNRLH